MDKTKRGELIQTILMVIGASGLLVAGAFCPGLLLLARPFVKRRYSYGAIYKTISALDKSGCIRYTKTQEGCRVSLTKKGRERLLVYELGLKHFQPKGKWDKKWRLLVFDIPESRRLLRDQIRSTLKQFGFYRLQDSVWVYPYDCQYILELLRTKYHVRHDALFICAEHLDEDRWLKKHFSLTRV